MKWNEQCHHTETKTANVKVSLTSDRLSQGKEVKKFEDHGVNGKGASILFFATLVHLQTF